MEKTHLLCPVCAQRIAVEEPLDKVITCPRCGHVEKRFAQKSVMLTMVFSLTALIFYFPANIFPFMTIEMYGNRNSATIWSGIKDLAEGGSWPIALIVFLASMLIPIAKLLALFYLSYEARKPRHPKSMATLYRIVESIGRWSMLDIFLLAVLVAIMKLGPWTVVKPEIGSVLFVLVVIFTMLASAKFDPHLLWRNDEQNA